MLNYILVSPRDIICNMSLSIGIVGLPNVGKSTLFNALTRNNILVANYPFATIEPNTGIVPVPDARLEKLSVLYDDAPVKPATIKFVDIAGLVAGASKGEGLGNQFLANIRNCDAICHVVRAFDDSNVHHIDEQHDPEKDIAVINTEMILADLQTVEKRLPKLEKEARANPKLQPEVTVLKQAKELLDANKLLISEQATITNDQWDLLNKNLQLLTTKPVIYMFNVNESTLTDIPRMKVLANLVTPAPVVFICAKLESELKDMADNDRQELLESYGVQYSGLAQLISATYDILGLQSYITAGKKEVRAWTIPKGSTAPQAAGIIHSDFEKGFIAAQVVKYEDLISAGSESVAKASGKVTTVGRDYIVQPNDIIEFKFNVSKQDK